MNSKDLGADYVFAWPSAQLGVMGATQAVEIIKRREIEQARDPSHTRDALAAAYAAQHLTSSSASSEGFVDEVIPPSTTRARLSAAFMSLEATRVERGTARNLPL
jgi:acetyl-CoA carboxylase carboxyltransferase component